MYSLYFKIILILLLIISYNLAIFCQAQKPNKKVKSIINRSVKIDENAKLDSIDVNSYIKDLNIKFDEHFDRTANLYGYDTIYGDFKRDTVILNIDAIKDVYVKKIYFHYKIYNDSTIVYNHRYEMTCFVNYNDISGYMYLPTNYFEEYISLLLSNYRIHNQKKDELRIQKQKEQREQLLKERTAKFIRKYGKKYGTLVANNEIQLGMTKEMVEDSWDKPEDINRTVGSWGVHEQWVYSNAYLYFENGKLTSWQD